MVNKINQTSIPSKVSENLKLLVKCVAASLVYVEVNFSNEAYILHQLNPFENI
jgi:hypothetical protein